MTSYKLNKTIEEISRIANKCPYDAIRKAIELDWDRSDVMCDLSKVNGPIERFAIFKKNRTRIIINYSEHCDTEVIKTTSEKAYCEYMNNARFIPGND